ncbi:MAG TPA: hypothetical protein PKI46_08475 [Bacteroidales bacterium]|nr:hypothetical protein [Bacteroidales bacterium]
MKIKEWKEKNISPGKATIKKYLLSVQNNMCAHCGIITWNNKKIILEIEHKDGNPENNNINNLELICPNCHSQTPTYKGKNMGNGRYKRRERYKNNKSY